METNWKMRCKAKGVVDLDCVLLNDWLQERCVATISVF